MRKFIFHISLITLSIVSFSARAQESLSGLHVNPTIKEIFANKSTQKAASHKAASEKASPLELPFIDDFSKSIGFPNTALWQDEYVFANQTYAYDPLSIGVATFDAIDGSGAIYPNASSYAFGADTLTSRTINLYYPDNKTIFLSFYYQAGGLGDTPDLKDSLILEFYSTDSLWHKGWNVIFNEKDSILTENYFYGDSTTKIIKADTLTNLRNTFQQVLIPISEKQYLDSSFQFRFRNYASLSSSTSNESKASNADHWHIDYVILNKDRSSTDTIVGDIAICKPMASLLKTYQSLPYSHYQRAVAYEMEDSIEITYRNLTAIEINPKKHFEIEGLLGVQGIESFEGGVITDVAPMQTQTYRRQINYIFPIFLSIDSALFETRAFFDKSIEEADPLQWNDTTRFLQKFFNYYAYDDGTAENGYGIIGEGTDRAMVAMRFNTYKKDTLRAVQIFFNQTLNNANQRAFKFHVWTETNGKPGTIIYTQEGLKPQNEDKLNQFTSYPLDSIVVLENSFFIGWQKASTPEMLNVGFDVNQINNDKLYYNFSGNWVNSQFKGTIMIRPVFGKQINLITSSTHPEPKTQSLAYTIYPNPANDMLHIDMDVSYMENYRYTIFDIYGRVFKDETTQQSSFDVSNLNSGIYFIRIVNSEGSSTTKKFMIVR